MPLFVVRVAYQCPLIITISSTQPDEVLAYTFEDALVLENLELFRTLDGSKDIIKIRNAVSGKSDSATLCNAIFQTLQKIEKAAFALEILWIEDPKTLKVPKYIRDGLQWLQDQLRTEQTEIQVTIPADAVSEPSL